MKIAILEICSHTHYSAINGLIKTYSTSPHNSITLYTNESIEKALRDNGISENTTIVVKEPDETVSQFFQEIEKTYYDRLHLCTIEGFLTEFSHFKPQADEVIFHVHDIDIWFDKNWTNKIKNIAFNLKNKPNKVREIAKFVRDILIRNVKRKKILDNIQNRKHRFIVHSTGQKKYLSDFVEPKNIIIFPFAINEGVEKLVPLKTQKDKIRICIPGIVTDARRDYSGLFNILESILPQIKNKLVFDFLGFVEKREQHLLQKIQHLEQKGLEVVYYTEFVYGQKYDDALERADILLNNQKVTVSHTTKYGVSKESGMLFNIIRAAKPGILPIEYAVDKEFEDAILYYSSNKDLSETLVKLANKTIQIDTYIEKTAEIVQNFTPPNLYDRLETVLEPVNS